MKVYQVYEAMNWTVVFEAKSARDYPITRLAWNPRMEFSRRLVIGYQNGDLMRIRVSMGSSTSEVGVRKSGSQRISKLTTLRPRSTMSTDV